MADHSETVQQAGLAEETGSLAPCAASIPYSSDRWFGPESVARSTPCSSIRDRRRPETTHSHSTRTADSNRVGGIESV